LWVKVCEEVTTTSHQTEESDLHPTTAADKDMLLRGRVSVCWLVSNAGANDCSPRVTRL
jgi:hypothetical protein